MMIQPLRHIAASKINNFRDIGGYPTDGTKMVRWGRIYRCSGLFKANESDWSLIRKLEINTVIDLRTEQELLKKPVQCPNDFTYINQNMITNYNKSSFLKAVDSSLPMSTAYINMCTENPQSIARTLDTIASTLKGGNLLYFCFGGKDRTGILTALLHYILGVNIEDIISDYQISYTHRAYRYIDGINQRRKEAFDRAVDNKSNFSDPETIEKLIVMFDEKNYINTLKNNGLSDQTILELKQQLLLEML